MNLMKFAIWFVAMFFAFFQFFLQAAAGVIGSEWKHDFHLSDVELGNLSSAFFYTYALMQIPAGILFDHFTPRYILSIAALILSIGCWWLAFTDEYHMAFFARLLMGIGSSFGFIGMLQICATRFPPKRFAFIVGLTEGITMLAVTASVMLLTKFVAEYSWRIFIIGSGVTTLLLMMAVFVLFRDPVKQSDYVEQTKWSLGKLTKLLSDVMINRQVILCSLYGFFMFSIVNAFNSLWGIPFLMNTYSLNKQVAANMTAMVFIGIAAGGPLSGWMVKLCNQNRIVLIAAAVLATIVMSVIIFYPQLPAVVMYILLFFMGMFCAAYVQCFAVIKDSVHVNIRATALATSNMLIMLGAPVFQLLIGWLLEGKFFGWANDIDTAYRLSLGILPVGMFVAVILAWIIRDASSDLPERA